jgi:hypothetical protein
MPGMYAGKTTGSGNPVPTLPNGALDVNSLIAQMVDRTPWQWYDTLKFAPGAQLTNSYTLFQSQKGAQDVYNGNQVKTFCETNMLTGGMFTAPHDLLLKQIGFEIVHDGTLYDIIQVFKYSYFELTIDEKVFYRAPLEFHPPGVGLYGVTTRTTVGVFTNGIPNPYATRRFGDFSRYIPPLMAFNVTVYFPETLAAATNTASGATTNLTPQQVVQSQLSANLPTLMTQANGGAGIWLRVILDGLTDRPVQ